MVLAKCTAKSVECMNVLELLLPDAEHSRLKVFNLIICQMVTQKILWIMKKCNYSDYNSESSLRQFDLIML
jgi:hypothetical protein